MKILIIYGEENAGKTTTCRKILDWLNAHGWKQSQSSYARIENPADGWLNDFKVKGTFNQKTIAIYSPGDDCGHLRTALKFAGESPSCDILVATVRKGIHYRQIINQLAASPLHTVALLKLARGNSNPEKDALENELVNKITGQF